MLDWNPSTVVSRLGPLHQVNTLWSLMKTNCFLAFGSKGKGSLCPHEWNMRGSGASGFLNLFHDANQADGTMDVSCRVPRCRSRPHTKMQFTKNEWKVKGAKTIWFKYLVWMVYLDLEMYSKLSGEMYGLHVLQANLRGASLAVKLPWARLC